MIPSDLKIIVQVDFDQKLFTNGLQTAKAFETNHRDRNPVLCKVVVGNDAVHPGEMLLAHHNFFVEDSPYQIRDDLFSIYSNKNIFARLDKLGQPHSIFGNIMAERMEIPSILSLPDDLKKMYRDRVRVISDGEGYRTGQILLVRHYSDYEIIYNWQGAERRVIKVWNEDVVGKFLKNG